MGIGVHPSNKDEGLQPGRGTVLPRDICAPHWGAVSMPIPVGGKRGGGGGCRGNLGS